MKNILLTLAFILAASIVLNGCTKNEEDGQEEYLIGYPGPTVIGFYLSFQDIDGKDLVREHLDPMVSTPNKGLWQTVGGSNVFECERFINNSFVFGGGVYYVYSTLPLPEKLQGWDLEKEIVDTGHDMLYISLNDILWKSNLSDNLDKNNHYTIKMKSKTLFGDEKTHTLEVEYKFIKYDWSIQWQYYDLEITLDGKECNVDVDNSFESNSHWGCYGKREVTIVLH